MSDIDWNEQVLVKKGDRLVWDGINLREAVIRSMTLPEDQRAGLTIFGQASSGKETEDLYKQLIDEPICPICQRKVKALDKTGDWTGYDCPEHGRVKVVGSIFGSPSKIRCAAREMEAALEQARKRQPGEWAVVIRSDDLPD